MVQPGRLCQEEERLFRQRPFGCRVVVDFMILFRESVRIVQFTKKSRSFVRSFSRVSGSSESFSESFRLTSSLRPSFSFANRECQPSRSDSLPPSVPRSRSRIANASRVVQTHFRPPSLVLVRESQMPAESVRLTSSLVHNIQTNHEITIHNRAMVQMVINQHNIN